MRFGKFMGVLVLTAMGFGAMAAPGPSVSPQPSVKKPAGPSTTLPPTLPRLPTQIPSCVVNPKLVSVTLTKGDRPGRLKVEFEIVNAGRDSWSSGAGLQNVGVTVMSPWRAPDPYRILRGGNQVVFYASVPLPSAALPGERMLHYSTPWVDHAYWEDQYCDPSDRTPSYHGCGYVVVEIIYAPAIRGDLNFCNDDAISTDNRLLIYNVFTALGSRVSRTFYPR